MWATLIIGVSGLWMLVTIWAVRTFGAYSQRHMDRYERARDDIRASREAIEYVGETNRIASEKLTAMLREVQAHRHDDGTCHREERSA